MKTSFVVSSVFAVHVVVIGGALLFQGCGTMRGPVDLPAERSMPPVYVPKPVVHVKTPKVKHAAIAPKAKSWKTTDISSYIIRRGDTMSGIAHRYGVTVGEIMELNHISDQNKIMIGQKLVIPGKLSGGKSVKSALVKRAPVKKDSTPVPSGSSVYVVQSGDCLSVIAHNAGVTTKAICDANGLKNDVIYVGKKLVIPGGKVVQIKHKVKPPKIKKHVKPVVEGSDIPAADAAPAITDIDFSLPDLAPELPVSRRNVQYYTVKSGQTILDVVSEFNVSIADLRDANDLTSDLLNPGQKLIIPTSE